MNIAHIKFLQWSTTHSLQGKSFLPVLQFFLVLAAPLQLAWIDMSCPCLLLLLLLLLLQGEVDATIDEVVAAEKWAEVAAEDPEYVI
jgi:hypothetical protein